MMLWLYFICVRGVPCTYAFTHTPSLTCLSSFIYEWKVSLKNWEMIILLYSAWKLSNSLVSSFTVFYSLYFLFVLPCHFFKCCLLLFLAALWFPYFSSTNPSVPHLSLSAWVSLLKIWEMWFLRWICQAAPLLSNQTCFCFAPLFFMLRSPVEQFLTD